MNSILSEAKLKKLPRPIRNEPINTPKIIHFGPGAFFRSFVASLIDDVNQKDDQKWGILAVSLNISASSGVKSSAKITLNNFSASDFDKFSVRAEGCP